MKIKPNKIYIGNALYIMKRWDKHQIDMCITSPPYFNLRDYKSKLDIWGGNQYCNHKWTKFNRKGISGGPPTKKMETKGEVFQRVPDTTQSYCDKCGAWYGCLGREPTADMYIKHLCDIFDEVSRVLKPEGTLWVNIGDAHAGSGNGQTTNTNAKWLKKSLNKGTIDSIKKSGGTTKSHDTGIPNKSLMMIPFKFAIEMVKRGWILRNTIIWRKPAGMPEPVKDRFTIDFEYVFFFSKKQKYYFKQQLEKAKVQNLKTKPKFGGNKAKGYGNPTYSGKEYKINYEEVPYAVKDRMKPYIYYRKLPDIKEFAEYINDRRKSINLSIFEVEKLFGNQAPHHWFAGESFPSKKDYIKLRDLIQIGGKYNHQLTTIYKKSSLKKNVKIGKRNKRAVWDINTSNYGMKHFAVFPNKLIRTPIKAGCPEEGIVLDCFIGSGTTAEEALIQGKKFIGVEISKEYAKLAYQRIKSITNQTRLKLK